MAEKDGVEPGSGPGGEKEPVALPSAAPKLAQGPARRQAAKKLGPGSHGSEAKASPEQRPVEGGSKKEAPADPGASKDEGKGAPKNKGETGRRGKPAASRDSGAKKPAPAGQPSSGQKKPGVSSAAGAVGGGSKLAKLASARSTISAARQKKSGKQEGTDAAKTVAKGAMTGAAGGVAGMTAGAAKGLGQAALKSSRGRKAILVAALLLALIPVGGLMAMNSLVGAIAPLAEEEAAQDESAQAVSDDTDMDVSEHREMGYATDGTLVPWQVLSALQYGAGGSARPSGLARPTSPDGMECPESGVAAEDGLSEHALLVLRCGAEAFSEITHWHGVGERSNNPNSDHPSGYAVDAMIPDWDTGPGNDLGWEVANWYVQNAAELNINYIIWDGQTWSGSDWDPYSHPSGISSPAADHLDHVHVSVNRDSSAAGDGGDGGSGGPDLGDGLGPYSLSDEAAISEEEAQDRSAASTYVAGELHGLLQDHQGPHGLGLDAGTMRMDNGTRVVALMPDESTGADDEIISADDAVAAAGVEESYVSAISQLPVEGMNEHNAEQVFDLARNWYLGISADVSGGGGVCQISSGGDLSELTVTMSGGSSIQLNATQVANAALVIGAGHQMDVSSQGIVVALMTALQESTLRNLANDGSDTRLSASEREVVMESLDLPSDGIGSDWDSVGLFQQRPSMGWGTVAEIMDQTYSATTFYERLLEVDGWQGMSPTVAAQRVQASAHPDAYAGWEGAAQELLANVEGEACVDAEFSDEGWTHPLPSGTYTSGFGMRVHPIYGTSMMHNGTDWAAPVGTPIVTAQDGVVIAARGADTHASDPDYWVTGYVVAIDHGGGVTSTYNHLVNSTTVQVGQQVSAGEEIGQVGLSGGTTGAHLHFQVLTGPHEFVDPVEFLTGSGVPTN